MFKPYILLIDDRDGICSSLLTMLPALAASVEPIVVFSEEDAVRAAEQHDFAFVLQAYDGRRLDTLKEIHACPRCAATPFILVASTAVDDGARLEAYRSGAVELLSPPFTDEVVQAKLQAWLALAKKQLRTERHALVLTRENEALQAQRRRDLAAIAERKQAEDALRQSQEELRQLASYQDRIKEDERKRIAREIHDELGQNLLALRLDVSMLHARTASRHPRLNRKVGAVLDHIDTTMKAMRSIINNLRPAVLDLGLNAAIEWQVKEFQRRAGVQCRLSMPESELSLDDTRATALFRILQESLNNVLRHARATSAEIEVRQDDGILQMRVADNGIGMFPGCRRRANSFGLIGVKERISALGGTLIIETGKDSGTTLVVSMPVEGDVPEPEIDGDLPVSLRPAPTVPLLQRVSRHPASSR